MSRWVILIVCEGILRYMKKTQSILAILSATTIAGGIAAHLFRKNTEKNSYSAELIDPIQPREIGLYEKAIKRGLDVVCAMGAIVAFCPLYLCIAALVKVNLGSPVLFTQDRPGMIDDSGRETIFKMYKFRTMTDEKDENGNLLPDDVRLTKFGAWLRATSLDELPEAINILNGTMSVIGPRPQLVRDMTFMSKEQRRRHTAKPGLSGLAQINGRNDIDWLRKLQFDLDYIEDISLTEDIRIVIQTVITAFIKKEGITEKNKATAEDYGDYLLNTHIIDSDEYDNCQELAKRILK